LSGVVQNKVRLEFNNFFKVTRSLLPGNCKYLPVFNQSPVQEYLWDGKAIGRLFLMSAADGAICKLEDRPALP
jgi:hypothetical protein